MLPGGSSSSSSRRRRLYRQMTPSTAHEEEEEEETIQVSVPLHCSLHKSCPPSSSSSYKILITHCHCIILTIQ